MCKIILPIKKKYSRDILDGIKKYELRRSIPKRNVDNILIYETAPTSKVVGEIKIIVTHHLPLKQLWDLTKKSNSLTKKEFLAYFTGKKKGYAYEVSSIREFKRPMSIKRYGFNFPPQGFVYKNN